MHLRNDVRDNLQYVPESPPISGPCNMAARAIYRSILPKITRPDILVTDGSSKCDGIKHCLVIFINENTHPTYLQQ